MTRDRIFTVSCHGLIGVMALMASVAAAQQRQGSDTDSAFDSAMVDYERNHWGAAYAALSALADRGDPKAARIALQMWRYGPALYRSSFTADAQQVERWVRLWANSNGHNARTCLQERRDH